MIPLARRALAFLLLGAVLTLLSAWVIHGVNFWRARAAVSGFVSSASGLRHINIPGIWLDDSEFAEQIGADGIGERYDPRAARRASESTVALAITGFYIFPIALIDPDAAWRRHRRVTPDMIANPSSPVGFGMHLFTHDRFGWNPGESRSKVIDYDENRHESLRISSEALVVFNAGWPWRSTQTGVHHIRDTPQRTTTPPVSLAGGVTLWTNGGQGPLDRFALPLFPLWPGFALNTLAFAAAIALLWHAPLTIRRLRRKRAGHCLACGYDLVGLARCPECCRACAKTRPMGLA